MKGDYSERMDAFQDIDADTRTTAEIAFASHYKLKMDPYLQPHDQILGMAKRDLEARNLRTIPLSRVKFQFENRSDSLKKRKIHKCTS